MFLFVSSSDEKGAQNLGLEAGNLCFSAELRAWAVRLTLPGTRRRLQQSAIHDFLLLFPFSCRLGCDPRGA